MGFYTRYSRRWLDQRYKKLEADGVYYAHQPVYGRHVAGYSEPGRIWRLARQFQNLRLLLDLDFDSFLDVGGSEGATSALVRKIFGAKVMTTDLSVQASARAHDLFAVPGIGCDAARLPFRDQSFDVVLCTEMIEHVEWPVETFLELCRVSRKAVILATDECRIHRKDVEDHRPSALPHAERNRFHPDDFRILLGSTVTLASQFRGQVPPESLDDEAAEAWIREATSDPTLIDEVGVVARVILDPSSQRDARFADKRIIEALLEPLVPLRPLVRRESPPAWNPDAFACPLCVARLARSGLRLLCENCGSEYPIIDGIPSLHAETAPDPTRTGTERRLNRLWPGDPIRVAAALAIRSRLEAPPICEALEFDFSKQATREEWSIGSEFQPIPSLPGRGWQIRSLGTGPIIISPPLLFPATGVSALKLDLSFAPNGVASSEIVGQLYFMSSLDESFTEERSVRYAFPADGQRRVVTIPLCAPPIEGGVELALLRLDLADRAGDLELHSMTICPGG